MAWGISKTASRKERLKSEFGDYLNGLNSCGKISYSVYCNIFDESMKYFDKMHELSKGEQTWKEQIY